MPVIPKGLAVSGCSLWKQMIEAHDLEPIQLVQLKEACKASDRLDDLNAAREADPTDRNLVASINSTLAAFNRTIAAMRLPDAAGKLPKRPGLRGAYRPRASDGVVTTANFRRSS